ncbi:GNAT family N-acetyltransferase [Ferrimonas gelatinilytica]|uniref:GNAT family N-acetyltransferase n=1 Tax=Ferrimonas gelatinilytica TaxID=1255257 RepID=A0ABP9S830_9GAMM
MVARGARVVLRRFGSDDVAGFYAMNADSRVLRYTGDQPFADEAACRAFLMGYDHYLRHGFGRWSLYLADGRYAGFCGLRRDDGLVDLGFRLPFALWGQGLASEAGALALRLGFEVYGLGSIIGRARTDNPASCRVLQKLGMAEAGTECREDGLEWRRFTVNRADWRARSEAGREP